MNFSSKHAAAHYSIIEEIKYIWNLKRKKETKLQRNLRKTVLVSISLILISLCVLFSTSHYLSLHSQEEDTEFDRVSIQHSSQGVFKINLVQKC